MTTATIQVQAAQPTADESAAALAAAAAAAPTTEAEARAQIAAAEAAKIAPAKPVRPDSVPEKFWDAEKGVVNHEALLASYTELEKKVGAPKEETKPEGEKTAEQIAKEAADKAAAEDAPKKASEVVADLNSKFLAQDGKLTDADYAAAEAIGHDRATVDAFIAGQQALAEVATQRITSAAGGKESMDRMFAWASTSIPAAEIETFNKSFEGSDVNAAVVAMEQLKAKYEAANGKDPTLVAGKPGANASDVFTSWAQVQAAMGDERYSKDHAYRTQIEQKLARSNNIR
ncbi:hypothetical protein C7I87_00650 [Mesorhizobium sp. SARCC-RB16n]|uniref:capsid assembly protein n=1 Tax=Mesorhizobium sp. SARCC-RB16n TaxID=2116687 RepID=UPI00122EECE6|nr:hypothetical protein [Mesorhizobium sp. SARCC-RB16n]KAA3452722.1 hypothetical protein C7I87_00650 [Mesorhizobium sp. SARCC-RB16n]